MKWGNKTPLPDSVGGVPVNDRQQWFLEQLASVGGGVGSERAYSVCSHRVYLWTLSTMKHFLQHISGLVLISKPCTRSGRMAPFYFAVKNARNGRPL